MSEKILMQDQRFSSQAVPIVAWSVIALLAAALFLYVTRSGIGLVSDSFFYLGGAEGMINGEGFARPSASGEWKPISHFPPLYAMLLYVMMFFLPNAIAPQALHVLLFAANTLLAGRLIARVSRSEPAGWLASLAWMASPVLLEPQVAILSEGLFFFVMLLFLWQMLSAVEKPRWNQLLAAGLLVGVLYLTRYAGASFAAPGVLLILLVNGSSLRKKLARALGFIAASALLPILWAIRNIVVTGSASNRSLHWHPPGASHLYQMADTFFGWVFPFDPPGLVEIAFLGFLILAAGAILVAGGRALLKHQGGKPEGWLVLSTLSASGLLAYLGLLVGTISFFDAATPLDNRILSPAYALCIFTAFALAGGALSKANLSMGSRRLASTGLLLLTVGIIIRGTNSIRFIAEHPVGFLAASWQHSPVVEYVRDLETDALLYSNEIDALYLLTGRMAYLIPVQWDPVNLQVREDYQERLETMRRMLQENQGYLILFSTLESQEYFPAQAVLAEGLIPVLEHDTGSVYRGTRP